ncbi:MAG: hypothetical protein IKU15_09595 [Clostridia bacterium]|nr:hypothetical protein [Clostridia bacterium]
MIIKELRLKEGMDSATDIFSSHRNLLYSSENTKGKTTYLRLLFFSLGYPIPNMKGIDFLNIETQLDVTVKGVDYKVERFGNLLQLNAGGNIISYTLPSEHTAFLSYIFQYDNIKVLENLLGFMYIDQDKGWSLLNRGTVIGKIKFSIEELLSGLNDVDITGLLEKRKKLNFDKNKYTALLNIQELSEQIYENNGELFVSDIQKEYLEKISYINLKISNNQQTLREINRLISGEKSFFDYIDSMKLFVKGSGENIPVNRQTLVNAPMSIELLKARRSIIVTDIEKLKRERAQYESLLSDHNIKNSQIKLWNDETKSDFINKKIASIAPVDQDVVSELLKTTIDELKNVNQNIKRTVKDGNRFINKIYNYVLTYAKMLKVEEKMVKKQDYIFTSDLKSMSGAVLQKMVFAFKVAFLKVIEETIGVKLFFVIDSPRGKELDGKNTELIMNLIKTELSENQIFIASIYDFECETKIELKNRAIENRNE